MRYIISFLCATTALAALAPAQAEVPRVVTDIPPVQALAAQVMGDLGQPELLLAKGASEHDFQLRPSQAASIAEAGLVIWVGPELTPWLDRAIDGLGADRAQLRLLSVEGLHRREYAAGTDDEDHDHEGHDHEAHDHDDHGTDDHTGHDDHADGHEGHSHTGLDPHAWLDPGNAQLWLTAIAAELGRIDPENAATYQANAARASEDVGVLDAEVSTLLAPARTTPLIMQHQAYGYFAAHYGLTVVGSLAGGDATTPGAAHLAELRATVAGLSKPCLFPEAQHDDRQIAQIAAEAGARVGGALDPVGSTLEPGPQAYAALMTGLATTIAACAAGG